MSTATGNLSSLAGTTWHLDPSESKAEFRLKHLWGLGSVLGKFAKLDGTMQVDAGGQCQMHLTIEASSLDTRNKKRDQDLRSHHFFHVEKHPEVRFVSTGVSDAGDGKLHVQGTLEAGSGSVQLDLEPTVKLSRDSVEIDAEASVDQRTLGMTKNPMGMIKGPAMLTVHAVLRRA
jgi:polyisoprenoid-binding protein YceI